MSRSMTYLGIQLLLFERCRLTLKEFFGQGGLTPISGGADPSPFCASASLGSRVRDGAGEKVLELTVEQIANAIDRDICRRIGSDDLRIKRVMALPGKDGSHLRAPDFLYFSQDADLVVNQHVMTGREAAFDILQLLFFMDIDQHAVYGFSNS